MKKIYTLSQKQIWFFMVILILGVIVSGVLTNITLRSIEKNLPGRLMSELNDLSRILDNLSELVTSAQNSKESPGSQNLTLLKRDVDTVFNDITKLRESYVFDNLVQASAFHAVIAPAIADLKRWLQDGVSGFGPESATTAAIAFSRVDRAYQKARSLNRESRVIAQTILETQRKKLDRFIFSANLLFSMTIMIIFNMVYLLIRQYKLQKRESAAKDELREQRDLLNSLFDNLLMGVIVIDRSGEILLTNRCFTEITGYSMIDIKTLEEWFPIAYPDIDYRRKVVANWEAALSGEKKILREAKVTCKCGAVKEIEWRGIFLKDGRILVTMSDITERKKTEKIIKESQEIKSRSKKMESLGLLAGGVAHDLNNILSGIVSYPELILLDIPKESRLRKPIETIKESGERAAAIVLDLLTVARGVATTKEPLNLNDLVLDYLNSPEFKMVTQSSSFVSVTHSLDQSLLNIKASQVHIRKIIMNLVANAAEAIKEEGNITISTSNCYVDTPLIGYEDIKAGEYAVLSVSDNGSGIAAEDLGRIFEPFYSKKVMGRSGTGLGLAVVWNVVQDHGGYINVKRNENITSFDLYFPVTRDSISARDLPRSPEEYKGNGETILVVDDMESQREITCHILEQLGYSSISVASGEEAVRYLEQYEVDLIVLDMIMAPGINGRETYEMIVKIKPKQRAIIASGFAETNEVKRAQQMGAGQYIRKPFTLENLGMAVKEELGKKD